SFTAVYLSFLHFFFQAEDGIRDATVTGVQTCALPIFDAQTVAVTFPTTFYRALFMGHRDLWPFPKAVLAEAFQGDKEAFLESPRSEERRVGKGWRSRGGG